MGNIIKINSKDLEVKEWKSERVVTVYDISNLHNREVKRVNEQFKRNIDKFVENRDYFIINREEIRKLATLSKYSNNKVERLFTSTGYLKLVRSFEQYNLSVENIYKVYRALNGKKDINVIFPNTRFEISFKNILFEALEELNIEIIHQFCINNYKLDFYIPKFNLVIEYDEEQHRYTKEKDKEREKYIKEKLKCKFLRLDYRNSDIKNLMKVLKFIYELLKELGYIYEE